MSFEKYGWAIQKKLICIDQSRHAFAHTRENSKVFNTISKYFSFLNNKPPAS